MVMKIFDGTVFLAEGTADTKGLSFAILTQGGWSRICKGRRSNKAEVREIGGLQILQGLQGQRRSFRVYST
jgi:hypothetical protein